MIRQYKRGWKKDKEMNKVLRLVEDLLNHPPLNLSKQIRLFNKATGKGRSSFFRYKRFLRDGTSYKRGSKLKDLEIKGDRLNQIVKKSYKIEFACNHWMRETGKSRRSFFRLKKWLKENPS